jgi:hypothetical protein
MGALKLLTEEADLICGHKLGHVKNRPGQDLVTVEHKKLLVQNDPEGRDIAGCPTAPPLKPCLKTLAVKEGYSDLVRIEGHPVCLSTLTGLTTGDPTGAVYYTVKTPGQDLVSEVAP